MQDQTRLVSLNAFDLSKKHERVLARRLGFDVPLLPKGPRRRSIESRLDKTGRCWLWTGAKNAYGYGVVKYRGAPTILVHRYMWELANGRPAGELVVMHSCDNRLCANPAHLSLGTHRDNRADCAQKGRAARGERAAGAKLTAAQVGDIRRRYAAGETTYKSLANEYGMAVNTIFKIVAGQLWRHVQ